MINLKQFKITNRVILEVFKREGFLRYFIFKKTSVIIRLSEFGSRIGLWKNRLKIIKNSIKIFQTIF